MHESEDERRWSHHHTIQINIYYIELRIFAYQTKPNDKENENQIEYKTN